MKSKSISHTAAFVLHRPAAELFPLFSPEGERSWVPGWDYENVMGTTRLHDDYVFLTKNHDHAASEAVWIVKSYDPDARRVQYYKVEPGEKVGVISVGCNPLDQRATRVEVTYTYIGLSEGGNRFVEQFTQTAYAEFIEEWKGLLDGYFAEKGDFVP